MQALEILILAIGLGTDAFSVGVSVGSRGAKFRQYFRAGFHFGLFQFFMPILGWLASYEIAGLFSQYNKFIAAGILILIAGHMLHEVFCDKNEDKLGKKDLTKGWTLVALSIATSIDAFGVGLGIGLIGSSLVKPCLVIGLVAALMTITGIAMGKRLAHIIGKKAEVFGACILLVIAVKIMLS